MTSIAIHTLQAINRSRGQWAVCGERPRYGKRRRSAAVHDAGANSLSLSDLAPIPDGAGGILLNLVSESALCGPTPGYGIESRWDFGTYPSAGMPSRRHGASTGFQRSAPENFGPWSPWDRTWGKLFGTGPFPSSGISLNSKLVALARYDSLPRTQKSAPFEHLAPILISIP